MPDDGPMGWCLRWLSLRVTTIQAAARLRCRSMPLRCMNGRHGLLDGWTDCGSDDRRRASHTGRGWPERSAKAHPRPNTREEQRRHAGAARRRTFELDNLIGTYDGLWLLTREAAKVHSVDKFASEKTEHGYGGARFPAGIESDIAVTSQAVKTIRLIMDHDVRALTLEAHAV
jgi:hypothetical protein